MNRENMVFEGGYCPKCNTGSLKYCGRNFVGNAYKCLDCGFEGFGPEPGKLTENNELGTPSKEIEAIGNKIKQLVKKVVSNE
jgi:hypothetical protein